MRKLFDAPELEEFEKRVKMEYGRQHITVQNHNEILNLIDQLRDVCRKALDENSLRKAN